MPVYFHRLENALKRANEFIDVGKKTRALEILCDVLRSRKHRTWQKKHEDIMVKYLELCVELRKSYVAKEGIYQYKIICQQTYIKSFEDVVRKYLQLAEEKAESAREEAQAAGIVEIDDLDNMQTPENILLSAVSSEDSQDRTDRVVLLPWVKFLWESYRQCLDLLKNNARTERLYHDIAHKAFQFCIKFNRKTEFRKLCDNLHAHLDILKKQQQQLQQQVQHQQQNIVNLTNPESQAMHLETRLVQLDCAIQMELWQEAYKATDDIKRFGLMNLSKKPPKPQLMASYYQKLALVFWKANCPLFHAAALFRLFHLTKELRKNITPEDVQRMASKVVCATLSIPIPPTRPEIDKLVDTEENVIENHQRNLASLLGLSAAVPNRSSLIKDLKRMGVLQFAYQPLQDLYNWLEVDFHPLILCSRVQSVIGYIEKCEPCPELKQYIISLKDVTIIRLLKEVSQVYQSIEYKRILEMCPFADDIYLENMVVNAARRNDLQVRIDHRKKCLHFGTELRVSQGEEVVEGPHLQSMPGEQIRQQLVNMYSVLQKAKAMIEPEKIKAQREELKRNIMAAYERNYEAEHSQILERQDYIEVRKEELEQLGIKRDEEERKVLEEKQMKIRVAEEERMKKEAVEIAVRKKIQEEEELRLRMAKDTIEQMKRSEVGNRLLLTMNEDELRELKVDEIKNKQWEQLEKERKEQLQKQMKLERKIDHLERAKRLEEITLLEAAYEEWKVKDRQVFEEMEELRIKELVAERELSLAHRDRLRRMQQEKNTFASRIKGIRDGDYSEKLNKWQEKKEAIRSIRLQERKETRKEERRVKYFADKKEAEEKRKEVELRKKMEAEKKKREDDRARLDEQALKQRKREEEVEQKQRQKEEETKKRSEAQDPTPRRDDPESRTDRPKPRAAEETTSWRRGKDESLPTRELAGGRDEDKRTRIERPYPEPKEPSWRDKEKDKESEKEKESSTAWRPKARLAPTEDRKEEEYDSGRDRDRDRDRPDYGRDRSFPSGGVRSGRTAAYAPRGKEESDAYSKGDTDSWRKSENPVRDDDRQGPGPRRFGDRQVEREERQPPRAADSTDSWRSAGPRALRPAVSGGRPAPQARMGDEREREPEDEVGWTTVAGKRGK